MKIAGFSLKSSSLILQTFYDKSIMVAVDRHLHRSFLELGWVHSGCTSDIESSVHVGTWLPMEEFININNVIAGLCQLLQTTYIKDLVKKTADEHHVTEIISKLDNLSCIF